MLPAQFIFVSIVSSLIGDISYILSIIKGHTKPNLVSWFIWALAPLLGFFFAIKAGAGISALPIFLAGFGPLFIIVVAMFTKNALWKITPFDIYCGILSIIALIIYLFTHNLELSILFAILSDALAFIPTYKKGWNFPKSESSPVYSFSILTNAIGLMIIKDWSFTIYSFGTYFVIANLVMVLILYRKKIFRKIV